MNPGSGSLQCLKAQVLTSSAGSESRGLSVQGNQGKVSECIITKAVKVKRWKTKKERNSTRHKSHRETFQKKAIPRSLLQRCNLKLSSGCSNTGHQTTLKDACNLKQVFITHSRLTQHHGIFNREVKSVDIGRLVNQTAELEPTKTDIGNVSTHTGKTPQDQVILNLDLIPTPELKDQEAPVSLTNSPPEMLARVPTPVLKAQLEEEVERPELCPQEDNSHLHITLPGSATRTSLCDKQVIPIAEAAEDILNMLRSCSLFPDRNLVSETRQSIVEKVRQICGSNTNLSQESAQKKLDYRHTADAHRYKDSAHEHARDRETDVRKSGQRPHSTNRQMPTRSNHFIPLRRDSPVHTLIKMVSSGDQQKITDDLHRPVNYGSGLKPSYKYKQTAEKTSQNLFNITSFSNPRQRDSNTSNFCRTETRLENMHSPSLHDDSPPVRWLIAQDDFPTHIAHHHSRSPKDTERPSVTREPLWHNHFNTLNRAEQSFKDSSMFDVHCSIWSCRAQKSPNVKVFDVSPAETRLCYIEPGPHRTLSRSNTESQRHVLEDTCLDAPDHFQLEDMQSFINPKSHTSSQLIAGTRFHQGFFPGKTMSKWRNIQESKINDLWSLQVDPAHKVTLRNDGDTVWNRHEDLSYGAPHVQYCYQQRKIPVMSNPYSQPLQQESSISPPYRRSVRKTHLEDSNTNAWLYPRMKLY